MNSTDRLAQALLDVSEQAVCVLDAAGNLLSANRAAFRLLNLPDSSQGAPILSRLGFSRDDLDDRAIQPGNGSTQGSAHWPSTGGESVKVSYRLAHVAESVGTWRWVLQLEPAKEPAGEFCDVEAQFRAIVDTITDGVIVIDAMGIIQLVNPAVLHLFGYDRDELIGRNINTLMPSPDRERHDQYLRHYQQTGEARIIGQGREVSARRKDGSTFPVYLSVGDLGQDGPNRFVGIIHDLSQRRHAEERLVLLSSAVEQAPAGILIANLQGDIEYVNEGFSRLTGYRADEVVGGNLFTPASVLQSVAGNAPLCWRLLSVREWCGEIKDKRKSGEPYCAFVTFSTIQDKQGSAIRLLARFQDITQQKIDQEALAESEARFSEVARMVGEWLWEQDASGRYTYCSEAVEDILGFPPESLIGKHYLDLMTEADRQRWTSELPPTERVSQPFGKLINHYLHRDGHEVFTESTGVPLINDRGETVRWRGVDMDITERKRVEDAVRLRERAIEAASVGIAIADARQPNFPNIYVNSALCRITGYTEHELLGRSLRLLQGKGTEETTVDTIRSALATGGGCEVVIRNYRKDGSGFWNELLLSPVHDDTGELTHYIGVIADISERRRAEDERHELEIARQIQMSLLPKEPLTLPDVEVAGVCIPAAQVGGDYYDFFRHGDCVDIVIADVSGHSVGAALIMAEMRSTLKAELRRTRSEHDSTAQLLSALNELLHVDLNGSDLFITMFYLRYNCKTRMLRYASAGHNPPLLLRASASACSGLDADGLILGVNRSVHFVEEQQVLEPGDQILLYTDGVTETQNVRGEFYGGQRLCRAFTDLRQAPPDQTLEQLLDQLRDFRGTAMFLDDITMVAFSAK